MSGDGLESAVDALDRALAARPGLDGDAFSEATRALCRYRDGLRRALKGGEAKPGDPRHLRDCNLAVTLLMAGHYPLGEAPWTEIEGVRDRLAALSSQAA